MTHVDKTQIRNTIIQLHHDGEPAIANILWNVYDAYRDIDAELTLHAAHSPAVGEIENIVRAANLQHSQIAGQTILACLSHYFDDDTNRLLRCQTPNGHHDMHTHRLTNNHAVHLYLWDDNEAFTTFKSEPTT